ncbi:hypothetical protein PLICRDRAFT_49848 [Plicaturopsis crispa FD-325 SS-3]|nr:hypothetical protein PLICRDRAFT_49848 [Plicaturopsis crispa FD-325 SS-3]
MAHQDSNEPPLPYGWVKEFDQTSNHPYWVDTKATPPRAIWVHPYEDELFLKEHPDIREKVAQYDHAHGASTLDVPKDEAPRRHSFSGESSAQGGRSRVHSNPATPDTSAPGDKKRGFFGKMKDKAIGTKEEREAYNRQVAAAEQRQQQRRVEQYRQLQQMQAQNPRRSGLGGLGGGGLGGGYSSYSGGYGGGYGGGFGSPRYGPPAGYPQQRSRFGGGGFGGGGMAMPLLGGMAGGLLLGDMMGGGFGGGGFDGGGFGGGGFDGGGFGGGGF